MIGVHPRESEDREENERKDKETDRKTDPGVKCPCHLEAQQEVQYKKRRRDQ